MPLPPPLSTAPRSKAKQLFILLICWLMAVGSFPIRAQIVASGSSDPSQPTGGPATFKLMLCTDGTITGWGSNNAGQLGSGPTYAATPTPVNVSLPGSVVKVVGTWTSSFAILADGTLWAWGDNSYGQLGVGSAIASTAVATRVPTIANVVAVTGSLLNTFALCADGTVWSWGYNQDGALGTGTVGPTVYTPQQIAPASLHDIRAIASGPHFCLALDVNGHVWSWGQDWYGELGTGEPSNGLTIRATPAQLPLNNVRQIDASHFRSAALCTNGSIWAWGENADGRLGLNNTAYTNTPAQVIGSSDVVWLAINEAATIAVRESGATYVWGTNQFGSLGVTTPAFATVPITGPQLSPNAQVAGQSQLFTSIERTGAVKTWGTDPLGYTPSAPIPPDGGSYFPTIPTGMCLAVPHEGFPACGPLRAYFQRSGATYAGIYHGNNSPANLGTYGTTTTIDASQPPYNGTVVFDGEYHVRGDVRFINGTFSLLKNTRFYVDDSNGQPSQRTGLEAADATLQLNGATLQASCTGRWNGIRLAGHARLYTQAVVAGKLTYRSVIRDAQTGVYCYTPDWQQANTNEYYLLSTDFRNNETGLYDLVKGTAQPGEGVRDCSFEGGYAGIQLDPVDYAPTTQYGGDYHAAVFDANTFKNQRFGIVGIAGQLRVTNSTFVNNYVTALQLEAPGGSGEISRNTVVVPSAWPADLLAQYPAGYAPYSQGIYASGPVTISNNSVVGATTNPAGNNVQQVGMVIGTGPCEDNLLRYLDTGMEATTNDNFSGSSAIIRRNTFTENGVGLRFSGYSLAGYPTFPVSVTLRCNTFASSQPGAVGVWVTQGTPFPASLGTSSQPNGNKFDGIADATKRFVYDITQPIGSNPFTYFRYNSSQEEFAGNLNNLGDLFYNSQNTQVPISIAVANRTTIAGTSACGNSTTPGVHARSVRKTPPPGTDGQTVSLLSLSTAYPNPATETAAFAYTLPDNDVSAALVLRDLLGREVVRQPLATRSGEVRVSVQRLPAGFYTSALEMAGSRSTGQKLTVVH